MRLIPALFLACTAQAQVVQCWPTNHYQAVVTQNNLGKLWPSWQTDSSYSTALGNRTLTVVQTVNFNVSWNGSKQGAPHHLLDIASYRQIGQVSYRQTKGERVILWAPRAIGGWVAQTNAVPIDDAIWYWSPSFIGTTTTGDRYYRQVATGSSLECACRNVANAPYLVKFKCYSGGLPFDYSFRFEAGQSKLITLEAAQGGFSFNLDEATQEQLQW